MLQQLRKPEFIFLVVILVFWLAAQVFGLKTPEFVLIAVMFGSLFAARKIRDWTN